MIKNFFSAIANAWQDFWFEWHQPLHISYGGTNRGVRVIRKQRLFNVIVLIVLAVILMLLINAVLK